MFTTKVLKQIQMPGNIQDSDEGKMLTLDENDIRIISPTNDNRKLYIDQGNEDHMTNSSHSNESDDEQKLERTCPL